MDKKIIKIKNLHPFFKKMYNNPDINNEIYIYIIKRKQYIPIFQKNNHYSTNAYNINNIEDKIDISHFKLNNIILRDHPNEIFSLSKFHKNN